jgi:hypothetical protein
MMFFALSFLVLGVAVHQIHFLTRRRKLKAQSWPETLAKVEPIDLAALKNVASMFLEPAKDQLRCEPNVIWQMLGGLEGVQRLKRNADAMLELAVYAERWNDDHGACVSELIRRDALRLTKAVQQIEWALVFHVGIVRAPFALLEMAGHYELIRRRLLGLYQESHAGLLPALSARI